MNIFLFIIFLLVGLYGFSNEIRGRKNKIFLKGIFLISFILCGMSRVSHTFWFSDLSYYIDYYQGGSNVYFEPGYVLFTDTLRDCLGTSGYVLVASVGIVITVNLLITCRIIDNNLLPSLKIQGLKMKSVFFTFSIIYLMYWGFAFEAERLRVGIATSFLLLSVAMVISNYKLFSFFPIIIAVFFHYTSAIFFSVMLGMYFYNRASNCKSKNNKLFNIPSNVYFFWFLFLLIFDVVNNFYHIYNASFIFEYLRIIDISQMDHYMNYDDITNYGIYSLQYIFYHLLGIFMLRGNFKNRYFNMCVFIYYVGLSLNTFLYGIPACHRVSDLFIIIDIYIFLFMGLYRMIPLRNYMLYIFVFSILQSIMCINYLGISFQ